MMAFVPRAKHSKAKASSPAEISDIAAQVGHLKLNPSRALGSRHGLHPIRRRGDGLIPADSRPYQIGDDLRRLDHRLSARRPELWIRSSEDEASIGLEVIVDATSSMKMGEDVASDRSKMQQARRLTIALAILAERNHERFGLTVVTPTPRRLLRLAHRKHQPHQVAQALEQEGTGQPGDFAAGLLAAAAMLEPRSWVMVVTDGIAPEQKQTDALRRIRRRARLATVIQIIHPHEQNGSLWPIQHTTLRDLESGTRINVGPDELDELAALHARFIHRSSQLTQQAGWGHITLSTDGTLIETVASLNGYKGR